jgi:ubiquinone/menaquinone biosynthesis C-methylase UbiE
MSLSITGKFVDPAVLATHFHVLEGDVIADFGAGSGNFLKLLSTAAGPSGRVYALEIQKALVEKIGILIREEHLMNVQPIWCDLEVEGGTKLQSEIVDVGILMNTLFQFENKEAALKEVSRVIRRGGKLFVVDWTDSFRGMGPQPKDVVQEVDAKLLVERAGFVFERAIPAGDHHYGLAFRKQ